MRVTVLTEKTISKIREILFYMALTIELIVALVEKSELYNPYESYIFRVTFLIALIVVALTPFNLKQWFVVVAMNVLGLYCYLHTGRNDLWRIIVFVCACTAIDIDKALRYFLWVTIIGCALIALLSITGIFGEASLTAVYRANQEAETRYCLGFGHPNGLQTMAFVITALYAYVYRNKMKFISYIALLVMNGVLFLLTDSRTSFAITLLLLICYASAAYVDKYAKGYIHGIVSLIIYIASFSFSMWAAKTANKTWTDTTLQYKINSIINGRIMSLYFNSANRRGWAGSWSLFSDSISTEYFDMGWVRLYYWYGIIPASIIVGLIFLILIYCLIKKDSYTAVLIAVVALYTVIEAHFVSDYNGRNFVLLIIGMMWSKALLIDGGIKRYLCLFEGENE